MMEHSQILDELKLLQAKAGVAISSYNDIELFNDYIEKLKSFCTLVLGNEPNEEQLCSLDSFYRQTLE